MLEHCPAGFSNQIMKLFVAMKHCQQPKNKWGDVLLAVRRGLEANVIENDSWNSVEKIWTAINLGDCKVFICVLYFTPDRAHDTGFIDNTVVRFSQ